MSDKILKRKILIAALVTFLLLVLLYFLPVEVPHKMVFPMAALFIFGFFLQSWPIIVAALFSAIGDYFGDVDNLTFQIASFAVAQCMFIIYFLVRAWKRKKSGKGQVSGIWFAVVTLFAVGAYYLCASKVIPYAPAGVVRTGFYVYGGLLVTMMWSALMQKDWMWGVGAVLFVFSDCIIAINSFVSPVPNEAEIIMGTYYAAQILIFSRAASEQNKLLVKA